MKISREWLSMISLTALSIWRTRRIKCQFVRILLVMDFPNNLRSIFPPAKMSNGSYRFYRNFLIFNIVHLHKFQIKIVLKYRVYLELIDILYVFQKLEDFARNPIFLLLWNYRSYNTLWRKNSISDLSKNLSKLTRCEISWRVESANVRKLFADFEAARKRLCLIDLVVRLQSNGKYEDVFDSCQTNPAASILFANQSGRMKVLRKKKKKKRESWFFVFYFSVCWKWDFFSITVRIFSIARKKNSFVYSQERFYKYREHLFSK